MDTREVTNVGFEPDLKAPKRVAVLAYPGCQSLDVLGPLEVFASADGVRAYEKLGTRPLYQVEILAPEAGAFRTMSGLGLVADRSLEEAVAPDAPPIHTLLVAGGDVRRNVVQPEWISWLRTLAGRSQRVGSVCTGTFLLAESGLLDGRRATTHWVAAPNLRRRFPKIE